MMSDRLIKLQAAADRVATGLRSGETVEAIIAALVADHGARHRQRWDGCRLSAGGVTSSCTAGNHGLLANWRKAATLRLMAAGDRA